MLVDLDSYSNLSLLLVNSSNTIGFRGLIYSPYNLTKAIKTFSNTYFIYIRILRKKKKKGYYDCKIEM